MNMREKGNRTSRKAIRYALSFPGTVVIPLYQVSRWATPQPFDLLVLRTTYWPRFVEVRANAWRTGRASTVQLAHLPGESYHKQIWRLDDGQTTPTIRQWHGTAWIYQENPWESGDE